MHFSIENLVGGKHVPNNSTYEPKFRSLLKQQQQQNKSTAIASIYLYVALIGWGVRVTHIQV